MKKKMLLFVGLLAFFMPSSLHTFADTGFTPPSTPDFSVSGDKNSSKNDSKDKTDSSSNSSITDGTIKPPIDNLDDFGSDDSPSKVMTEAERKKARANLDNYTSLYVF
ncbi:hypothetical protein [Lactococcus lactis]|uniref:Uncharacterized protein n=2 Tax=Lactococcus lactis TaxID=1358 RepID=A0A2A5SJC6_LACLH|nr:hypothetical protein [Lactococcus lactis]PCS13627.1 hypothetical protein RU90_GL002011 [Lactococcus lactis subsp. hordniae]